MSFYGWILLGTIIGPLALSFERRIAFYTKSRALVLAVLIIAVPFLIWDWYFTDLGVWGFNNEHIFGLSFFGLPLEEILFFVIVPYACLFVYEVVQGFFGRKNFDFYGKIFGFTTALSAIILAMTHMQQWYTLWATILASLAVIGVCFQMKAKWFGHFAVAFTICILPFLVVNGLLTGIATSNPVVWYNEDHITGFRILTIPMEDFYYNLGLYLSLVFVYEWLKTKKAPSKNEDAP